ncbi:MAG: hypothetical protein QXN05_03260 [Acidilobaceae archaeon]
MESSETAVSVSQKPSRDSIIFGFIAWFFGLLGAVIVFLILFLTKREDRYAKFWVVQAIAFTVVTIIATIVAAVLAVMPFLGKTLSLIVYLVLLALWLLGIYYSITGQQKRPPVVGLVSERLEPLILS